MIVGINDDFQSFAPLLDTCSCYTHSVHDLNNQKQQYVLPRHLATLGFANEHQLSLSADTIHSVKFESPTDSDYQCVRLAFQSLIDKYQEPRRPSIIEDTSGQLRDVQRLLGGCDAPQDDLSFFSDKRVSNSCEWILDHATMLSFLENKDPQPHVLWCFGNPGCGKSVTATHLIESLLEDDRPCAYYYFRSGNPIKNNLSQFLSSVAYQISQHVPAYRRKLASLAAERFDASKASHKLLWKKLFISALAQCDLEEPIFIVVDGLDELGQVKDLLQKMFVDLGDISIPLRLLMVSRPTLDIELSIDRLSWRMLVQRLSLGNNADDLHTYVRDEMETMMGEDDFKERTMNELLRKANGNFLWAHLVVREILDCQTEGQVEAALQEVPKELEDLYIRMDSRLADLSRSRPQDTRMGHTVMMWAACARRPLHLREIQTALEHDFPRIMDMRHTVQRLCGEFVLVDKKGHVSMMHASAREFLTSPSANNYHVDVREANHVLLTRCMQTLANLQSNIPVVGSSDPSLLEYAAIAWPYHLTQSSDYQNLQCLLLVMGLFQTRAVFDWLYLLVRVNNLRAIVEASRALRKLLTALDREDRERNPLEHRLSDKETLLQWAQDLIRVVGKFGPQITRHPASVYSLMPSFCPGNSVLLKLFRSADVLGSKNLSLRGSVTKEWGECFAKFSVQSDALPFAILHFDRYFAILTKDDGTVHLYYSATCEIARRICHREVVTTFCVNFAKKKLATYSLKKTVVWDIQSGRLICSVENPPRTRAIAITFQRNTSGREAILGFFDDRLIRSCALDSVQLAWEVRGGSLVENSLHQVNSPRNAVFSSDGSLLAISYRGAHPSVWQTGGNEPRFLAQCTHRARRASGTLQKGHSGVDVQSFAWNPLTGHLLGIWNDGIVFRWHPQNDDYTESDLRGQTIKCSGDGKFFATGGGDGTLRIWDCDHFVPIYQLRHPNRIQDIAFGDADARVYDLREQFCNIWEPNSLLRALEGDDLSDDARSSKLSEQHSLASEAVQEDFEPVTALAPGARSEIYAFGDESGKITVSDYDGEALICVEASFMGIEKLVWSQDCSLLASVDLGREVTVREVIIPAAHSESWGFTTVQSFTENDIVQQLLISPSGDRLLLATPTAMKIQQIPGSHLPTLLPTTGPMQWCKHPNDASYVLGFSATKVLIMPWTGSTDVRGLTFESAPNRNPQSRPQTLPSPRRASGPYPFSPSELDVTVRKVLVSTDGSLVMLEIYSITKQARRPSDHLFLRTEDLTQDNQSGVVPVSSVTGILAESLSYSLGFIDSNSILQPISIGPNFQNRSFSRRGSNLSVFAFIDTDFWVCSVEIDSYGRAQDIHKHYFLPRDWQNAEWLEMATVTSDGHLLCPRNGDIAVVSNGFLERMVE